jgi:two-component system, OmpR family, sensor histidine kinase ChvG
VRIVGAPELVAQLLDKLIANAVEFATADPVTVALDVAPDTVRLAVDNLGPPLPAEMQGRLFDSMVSVRAAARGEEPHLGLGLYIVRLVAQFHGAAAHAANRADGRGVTVGVVFARA